VTKVLDGTDVLVILPVGTVQMAISTAFVLVLNRMKIQAKQANECSTASDFQPIRLRSESIQRIV
jgi:hypothetical protein